MFFCERLKKTFLLIFAILNLHFLHFSVFATTGFSALAGLRLDFFSSAELNANAFFACQLDFAKNIFLRAGFSINTGDIFSDGLFDGTPSIFRIDEISFTYRKTILSCANYFSLFVGDFEPIGGDSFLQRHFGMEPISSKIADNWLGVNISQVYPLETKIGGAYSIRPLKTPFAFGVSIFFNRGSYVKNTIVEKKNQWNFDARMAMNLKFFTMDFSLGICAPVENKYNQEDVFVLIDTIYMRLGWNALIGNNYSKAALYTQGGFTNLALRKSKNGFTLLTDDFNLLIEPRFKARKCTLTFSFYNFPQEKIRLTPFFTKGSGELNNATIGLQFSAYNDRLHIKNVNLTFGISMNLYFPGVDLISIPSIPKSFLNKGYQLGFMPYVAIPIRNGTLNMMLCLDFTNFIRRNPKDAVKFLIGYKASF